MPNVLSYPTVKTVIACGDIHGDFKSLVWTITQKLGRHDTLTVVAGDCGMGFNKPPYYEWHLKRLSRKLARDNNHVAFVRGNHDDPAYFESDGKDYGNIRTVPDYTVIQAAGKNILCVGGATSPDRVQRQQYDAKSKNKTWWKGERPVFRPDLLAEIPKGTVDTVITHTSTSNTGINNPPWLSQWALTDPELPASIIEEKRILDKILKTLLENDHPVKEWYYGHYHLSGTDVIDGIRYTMLAIQELKEIR